MSRAATGRRRDGLAPVTETTCYLAGPVTYITGPWVVIAIR